MARKFRRKSNKNNSGKIKHIKTEVDGIVFDSKMESQYYLYLKDLVLRGVVKSFTRQDEFTLQEKFIVVDGQVIYGDDKKFNKFKKQYKAETIRAIKYVSDFIVNYSDGHTEVVDTKGKATVDFEIKKKMFLCKYPELNFKVLIYDKKKDEWVDYYSYQKELRAAKRAKKLQGGK